MKYMLDNCLPPRIALAMRTLGWEVCHLRDEFPANAEDTTWIPPAAKRDLVAISDDRRMYKNAHERAAIRAAGLRVLFMPPAFSHMSFWHRTVFLVSRWEAIVEAATEMAPGQCVLVPVRGSTKRV